MVSIVWILSPLVLIPIIIITINKNSKLKLFLNELLKNGRITKDEFNRLTINKDIKSQFSNEEKQEVNVLTQNNTVQNSYSEVKQFQNIAPEQSELKEVNDKQISQKTTNSSNILFGIGVCFVILSGIIFSTAVWFYISDIARIGIIALAALLFFGLSCLSQKKFKLKNTSIAFFTLGTIFSSITFVTAGYFELFGQWFSVSGSGNRLFFSAALLIIALISTLALKLYKKNIYIYFTIYPVMMSATLILAQISGLNLRFSMLISLFGVIITGIYYYLKNIAGVKIIKPISNLIIVTRVIYGILSLPLLFIEVFEWSVSSWVICVLCIAELSFYGLKKNNKVMLFFQCIFIVAAAIELAAKLSDYINDNIVLLGLVLVFVALVLIYRLYKPIYNVFSDAIFMIVSFITSVYLLFTTLIPYSVISEFLIIDKPYIAFGVIAMTAVTVLIAITAFNVKNILHKVCRVVLPLPFLMVAYTFYNEQYMKFGKRSLYTGWVDIDLYSKLVIPYVVCSALFIIIAFMCRYAVKKDHGFVLTKYSFEVVLGILLVVLTRGVGIYVNWSLAFVALLSIAAFIEIQTSEKNAHSIIPMLSMFLAVSRLINNCFKYPYSSYAYIIASVVLCAVMTVVSRLMFRQGFCIKEGKKVHFDIPSLGIIFSAFLALKTSNMLGYSSSINLRLKLFIFLIETAVFAVNLHRKNCSKSFNLSVLTISSVLLTIALIIRPFFRFEGTIIANKIIFIIIVAFGFAVKKIWSDNKKVAENFSTFVYMFTYILLLGDALVNQTLANTLIVLITSLVIMLFAFMRKRKSWFILSAGGLVGLTLYMTKDFIKEIHWWVYLLVVGILLIVVAAFNEYFKAKGESVKNKTKDYFDKWTW